MKGEVIIMPNQYFKPIEIIADFLDNKKIENTCYHCYEGYQLRFNWCKGDVACHSGTYGSRSGYVETYNFPWDDGDVSMLTPIEAANKIYNYYVKMLDKC
jgi:hypothetical protein